MSPVRLRFGAFVLDTGDRSLRRDGVPVAINARYFDALTLLLREQGRLVGKQRFFDEVWAGSVVTDAALTQCIKELRRLLGDDASEPRFVRTVQGHGYCFIAAVATEHAGTAGRAVVSPTGLQPLLETAAAMVGGAAAGLIGGLLYGSALAAAPATQGLGMLSVVLVLLALSVLVGMAGAGGVGLGLALGARLVQHPAGTILGGALGGLLIGGLAELLTSDGFTLLTGQAPADITGAFEGAVIGGALTAGLWLAGGTGATPPWRPVMGATLGAALAGALLPLLGGTLMAASLAQVASTFGHARLDVSASFMTAPPGAWLQSVLGALEVGIFGACVSAGLVWLHLRKR